jgi:hypothetical protein
MRITVRPSLLPVGWHTADVDHSPTRAIMTHHSRVTSIAALLVCATPLLLGCGGDTKDSGSGETAVASAAVSQPVVNIGVECNYPPLKNSAWLTGEPSVPISIVIAGLQGEITVDSKTYNGAMQAWGMLSDDDVANVLTYARSQWGNTAGPVTAAQVKAIRGKMGSRGRWTAAELKKEYPGAGG